MHCNIRFIPFIFLFFSVLALGSAYIMEYGFGILPCEICLYQRVLYFVSIALSLLYAFFLKKILLRLLILSYIANMLVAFYQVAIEYHWIENIISCTSNITFDNTTSEEVLDAILHSHNIPCDVPQLTILGISIAGWNVVYCASVLFLSNYCRKKYEITSKKT